MTWPILLNDVSFADRGFNVMPGSTGFLSPARQVTVEESQARAGGVVTDPLFRYPPRHITIVLSTDLATTADVGAAISSLVIELAATYVRLRHVQLPDREFLAVWQGQRGDPLRPQYINGRVQLTLEFVCPIPFARKLGGPFIRSGVAGELVPIPGGSAPCTGILTIQDATTPTISYWTHAGILVGSFKLNRTHTTDEDASIVNSEAHRILYSDAGVVTSDRAALTEGNFFHVSALDDGDIAAESWPMISSDSGRWSFVYDQWEI